MINNFKHKFAYRWKFMKEKSRMRTCRKRRKLRNSMGWRSKSDHVNPVNNVYSSSIVTYLKHPLSLTINIIKFSPKTSFINNSFSNSFFLEASLFEIFDIFFGIFLSFELDVIHSSFELLQQFITTFHLLLVVVNIIIFPHSFVGCGSISNEIEMVHDEN